MSAYWGELAALGTSVSWALTALFFSYSGQRVGADVVNRSRLMIALLLLFVTHWFVQGSVFPTGVEPFRWGWFAVSSVLGLILGDSFLFQAFVLIGPRLSMLLMSTVPIYSTILAWLLFGETVSGLELTGILLAVGSVAWVVMEKQGERSVVEKKQYKRGLLFGMAGALGQVLNLVTARYGLVGGFPTVSATIIRIAIAVLIMWFFTALRGQLGHTIRQWRQRKAFAAILGGSFVGPFLGIWLSLIAVQSARLGIASTLMALSPVLLIPIEYFIFRKRVSRRGVIGTVLAFLGVALLFLPQP